ncbi:hypothetical protein QR77_22650 [Streptomyces sp. 150FB]|uniref:DUF3027 domain-containing protein n=1 Tax=Streptomyces sp. 150FB TaxID=1576605 RepID=UPI000589255B|nr:DUF3027 domain-containing protein [Streptomyces sp. 150FB]KIF75929.1 hypothetical protein QR77_22650 [Streptomyces sp. 150FB]
MSAATTRSRIPDRLCAEAVDLARSAAEEEAAPGVVGEHVSAEADGDRVVTHFFECKDFGYRGWRWAVTVTRASRSKLVTLDETVLLPGPDSLLAPEWVPWSERLRPGDMGPGDLLPTEAEDLRLEPGYTGEDMPPPNSVVPEVVTPQNLVDLVEAEDAEITDTGPISDAVSDTAAAAGTETAPPPVRGTIASVAEELGMRRARVLSRYGLHVAADRWDESFGAKTPMAQAAPAPCVSCGFLVPLAGSLRQAFGVCANEFSPADGRVVSLAYGCGGHSEAAVMPAPLRPAPPVLDSMGADAFPLRPSSDSGSVPASSSSEADTSEGLGHS